MKPAELESSILRFAFFGIVFLMLFQVVRGQAEVVASAIIKDSDTISVEPKPTPPSETKDEKIKVVFDDANPGVVYIEANGARVRVDVTKRLSKPQTALAVTTSRTPVPAEPPVVKVRTVSTRAKSRTARGE